MMGCVSSRSVSSSGGKLRLDESDGSDGNTRSIAEVNQMGGRDAYPSDGDMDESILISRGELDQSSGQFSGDFDQMSEFTATTERQEMSRDHAASLKRKRKPEDGLFSLASLEPGNQKRRGLRRSISKTNQLTAFILLLVQRRKRRLSARIEAGDLILANSPLTGDQKPRERDQGTGRSISVQRETSRSTMDDNKLQRGQIEDTSRSSSHPDDSNNLQHSASIESDPSLLFISVQQLCYDIINRGLLDQTRHELMSSPKSPDKMQNESRRHNLHNHNPQILCLFAFGLQGSSMGELSFELVQHSSLVHFIQSPTHNRGASTTASDHEEPRDSQRAESQDQTSQEHDCPLYHYIDVSALIVANIDQRIAVYHRLVGQALRSRRDQESRNQPINCEDPDQIAEDSKRGEQIADSISSESNSHDEIRDDDSGKLQTHHQLDTDSASLWSTREPSIVSEISVKIKSFQSREDKRSASANNPDYRCPKHNHVSYTDQFGMVTLSTRQRSILQLKLVKYATCVTAKWITTLIQREISRLEKQLCMSFPSKPRDKLLKVPPRVYLINLVPNQLSLFKTCLYLQQELSLNNFSHSFWAIKFERRSNIKVMTSERSPDSDDCQQAGESEGDRNCRRRLGKENNGQRLLHMIKLPQLKLLRAYLIARSQSEPNVGEVKTSDWKSLLRDNDPTKSNDNRQRSRQVGAAASEFLASSANQKFGPKVSANFANQFDLIGRLIRIRYNPTENINYASTSESTHNQSNVKRLNKGSKVQDACYQELRHRHIKTYQNESQSTIHPASHSESPLGSQPPMSQHPPPMLFIAVDDSSRSESATLEHSDTASGAQTLHPHKHQLDLRCLVPLSASPTSIISNESSELSGVISISSHSPRLSTTNSSVASVSAGAPKWAIELELIDSHDATDNNNKWYSKSLHHTSETFTIPGSNSGSQTIESRHEAPFPINCCIHVYMPPARRPSSRSPLSLVSTSSGRAISRGSDRRVPHHVGHYYLVNTPVAYANGRSQSILEAKTVHKRTIHYSSGRNDSSRLLKLLTRAQNQLVADLDTWLRDSLEKFQPHVTLNEHQNRHHASQHHRMIVNTTPHLVTYTIKVDVTKLLKRLSKSARLENDLKQPIATNDQDRGIDHIQLSTNDLALLLQMKPERSTLSKRPASAIPSSSDRERCGVPNRILGSKSALQAPTVTQTSQTESHGYHSAEDVASGRHRHVQFKLKRPPEHVGVDIEDPDRDNYCQVQTRVWVKDCLFVSCNNRKILPVIDLFIRELLGKSELG